ncbi:MAG TPA: hypothetical protein VLX92_31990 [Kofleriaceae bacterium]|nr:hypothetical protein [Kofleriaceae bacterium]
MSDVPPEVSLHDLALAARATPEAAHDEIATRMRFAAPLADTWRALMFYEQIDGKPPWYLRLLLPVPIGTEGKKTEVGDEALCRYVGGHLLKRVTRVEPERLYGFVIAEQQLAMGGGIRLSGGEYTLRVLPDDTTEVAVVTRYTSKRRPRWLWRRIEAAVCHLFHRHILRAMRRAAEA